MSARAARFAGGSRSGALAVVLAASIAACGSGQPTPQQSVAHYLTKVNAVERQLAKPLATVTHAGAKFARDQRSPTSAGATFDVLTRSPETALLQADRRISHLRAKLAAIPAPAPAHHLRVLLLRLIDAQSRLTRLSARLVVFLPDFTAVMKPLGPAIQRLSRTLSINQASGAAAVQAVYTEKERALLVFKATLDQMGRRLERLPPPAALRPNFGAELRAVRGMSASAGRLALALQRGDAAAIPQLLRGFDDAARLPQTLSAQKAQIAAIKSYNRHIARLNALTAQAERERAQLANHLS